MLRALAHPLSLLVLALSFVVGVTVHGWVQSLVAASVGDPRPRQEGRTKPDPRVHLDALGTLAALLSGLGWAKPVELVTGTRRGAQLAVGLAGPVANLLLGVAALASWRLTQPQIVGISGDQSQLLEEGLSLDGMILSGPLLLFGFAQLYLGALSLVPLPPLDGGRLLFALGPRSHGWRQAEYQLVERNFGVVAVLVLLLVPLGGGIPLLPRLLDIALKPLIVALLVG